MQKRDPDIVHKKEAAANDENAGRDWRQGGFNLQSCSRRHQSAHSVDS